MTKDHAIIKSVYYRTPLEIVATHGQPGTVNLIGSTDTGTFRAADIVNALKKVGAIDPEPVLDVERKGEYVYVDGIQFFQPMIADSVSIGNAEAHLQSQEERLARARALYAFLKAEKKEVTVAQIIDDLIAARPFGTSHSDWLLKSDLITITKKENI